MAQHGLPLFAGHEIIGRVMYTDANVTRFKEGDLAAVGCMVDSCRVCAACREGLEQYCEKGFNPTYNGVDKDLGGPTFGGYSTAIVVDEAFVLRVSDKLDLAGVAPLLCAGSPTILRYGIGKSDGARRLASLDLAALVTWA
jgi:alcohol dehydrogenase (NADP+)